MQKGFRIYTTIQLSNGSFVVVAAEVKNIGRDIEVNGINTIFGRSTISKIHEEVIYESEKITPEQQALLDGHNPHQYLAEREPADKGNTKSTEKQIKMIERFNHTRFSWEYCIEYSRVSHFDIYSPPLKIEINYSLLNYRRGDCWMKPLLRRRVVSDTRRLRLTNRCSIIDWIVKLCLITYPEG